MAEISFLNNFQKDAQKETNQIRFLSAVINDLKNNFIIIKSSWENDSKLLETFFKSFSTHGINFMSDISNLNENDHSNLLGILMTFGNMFDMIGNIFSDEYAIVTMKVNKAVGEIGEEVNSISKYIIDNSSLSLKELCNARVKIKSSLSKKEKGFKEIEGYVMGIRKKSDDNISQSEKYSEKVLNAYIDYDDIYAQYLSTLDECKKSEQFANENLKNIFFNVAKCTISSLVKFRDIFHYITDFKKKFIDKSLRTLSMNLEFLQSCPLELTDYERKYCEERNIQFLDFDLISYIFNSSNPHGLIEPSENIITFLNAVGDMISFKKKLIVIFQKFLQDLFKSHEVYISNSGNKSTKGTYLYKPPSTSLVSPISSTFVPQFYEYLKSIFDLFLKKSEEFTTTNNLLIPSLENVVKEITSDESSLAGNISKYSKEFSIYKNNYNKVSLQREKVLTAISAVKDSYVNEQTLDDSSFSFAKYEAKMSNLRAEEMTWNDMIGDINKKFAKFVIEFLENWKNNLYVILPSQEKEIMRIQEMIKESSIDNITKQMEKIFSCLNDYLSCKEQIIQKANLKDEMKNVFGIFLNENGVDENYLYQLTDQLVQCVNGSDAVIINEESDEQIFLNKEDIISQVDSKLSTLFKEEELNELRDRAAKKNRRVALKSSQIAYEKNLPFAVENEEVVNGLFSTTLIGPMLYIHGKLYITNKKVVFYSWYQPTQNGKTLIEIQMSDIVKKASDGRKLVVSSDKNEIQVISAQDMEKCIELISQYESGKKLNEETLNAKVNLFEERKNGSERAGSHHSNSNNGKLLINLNSEAEDYALSWTINDNEQNMAAQKEIQQKFIQHVQDIHKKSLSSLEASSDIRTKFNAEFVSNKKLACENNNISLCVPLCLIFKYIYDPDTICKQLNCNKNFVQSLQSIRRDYNITFNPKSFEISKIPLYYRDPFSIALPLLLSQSKIPAFMEQCAKEYPYICEYNYTYTHPVAKKQFMGPSKLEMDDTYKFIFVSPLCFIVEITTHIEGFMLMDTFFTVAQYKFETELGIDQVNATFSHDTKVTASFVIEFVKDNWFRKKIETNGMAENEEYIKDFMLPHICKALDPICFQFYQEQKKLMSQSAAADGFKEQVVIHSENDVARLITEEEKKNDENEENPAKQGEDQKAINHRDDINNLGTFINIFSKDKQYDMIQILLYFLIFLLVISSLRYLVGDVIIYIFMFTVIYLLLKIFNQLEQLSKIIIKEKGI